MNSSKPLTDETVLCTGTPKSTEPLKEVERLGGRAISHPLIEVRSITTPEDEQHMARAERATWLIFTSQSSVQAFLEKMERLNKRPEHFQGKIAAIGTKTAAALERIGFKVSLIHEVVSADVFVKQFRPKKEEQVDVVFLRGTLARSILRDHLPFTIKEWTVYETAPTSAHHEALIRDIQNASHCTVLFASPSAVREFATHIAPTTGWQFSVGAIGHVTKEALQKVGAPVHIMPSTYTLLELVRETAKRKEELYDSTI